MPGSYLSLLVSLICFKKYRNIFTFSIIRSHWSGAGNLNISWYNLRTCLSFTKYLLIVHGQYHSYWWPGDARSQSNSSYGTDIVIPEYLTHWGRVTHKCVGNLTIIGADNGLSPGRRQAIIWTNAGILLIRPLGTNFNEMLIEILTFSFMKMRLKVSSAKWRPFCLGLNVLSFSTRMVKMTQTLHDSQFQYSSCILSRMSTLVLGIGLKNKIDSRFTLSIN